MVLLEQIYVETVLTTTGQNVSYRIKRYDNNVNNYFIVQLVSSYKYRDRQRDLNERNYGNL